MYALTHINMKKVIFIALTILALFAVSQGVWAAEAAKGWGGIATTLKGNFSALSEVITAGCVIVGLGFSIGAIMKFKQHKDNPTQTPIGGPIALVFIGAALLFLPSILSATGSSLFEKPQSAGTAEGCVVGKSGECK